jgi:hypothetical protein
MRDGRRGFFVVHRNADNLRARKCKGRDLFDRAGNVRRVGVGHRLHDDRNFPAHANGADFDCSCFPALNLRHGI